MSPTPPPSQQPSSGTSAADYNKLLHNTAICALIACPLVALLPPRKLDFYTFGLLGLTGFSANYLTHERTGRSITAHLGLTRSPSLVPDAVSPSVEQRARIQPDWSKSPINAEQKPTTGPVTEEIRSQRAAWKEQRAKEIREEVEEGKSFQDMIIGQIWEVWNWGKPVKEEDD